MAKEKLKKALEDGGHEKHDEKSQQKKRSLDDKKDENGKDEANLPLPSPAWAPPDGWEGKIRGHQ